MIGVEREIGVERFFDTVLVFFDSWVLFIFPFHS